jgi:thymidylate synthase (FAD)
MQIYLISTSTLTDGLSRFLTSRGLSWSHEDNASDPELVAEAAGRVCYMSFGKMQHRMSTQDYLANILSQGHDSVLEHANFTLLADGITRALSHQLVRHRIGFAYSQLSQQYHDETHAEFAEPQCLEDDLLLREQWVQWCAATRSMHESLLAAASGEAASSGMNQKEMQRHSRSVARTVLPNATSTTLMITGNARAWRHMLKTRGSIIGDMEMREYCIYVYRVLLQVAPNLFGGFEEIEDNFGFYVRAIP